MDTNIERYIGLYYVIESRYGTQYVPQDVCGRVDIDQGIDDVYRALSPYIGVLYPDDIFEIDRGYGALYRWSAPGYTDCGEWSPDADDAAYDEAYGDEADDEDA